MTPKPTPTDLKIYNHMQAGNVISSMNIFQQFNATGYRDIFFRLRKAGFQIQSKMKSYQTAEGKHKRYCEYWIEQ